MNIKILGPTSSKIVKANWIDVTSTTGNYVVLPGHAPCIVQLIPNIPITMGLAGGAVTSIPIVKGILQVNRRNVTVILDE